MGKPNISKIEIKNKTDRSWKNEINAFYDDIINNNYQNKDLKNSLETLKIIKNIYKDNNYDNCS